MAPDLHVPAPHAEIRPSPWPVPALESGRPVPVADVIDLHAYEEAR